MSHIHFINHYTNPNRERSGKDWKTVAKNLGYGTEGGLYTTQDDNNPAWEDIEYESENEHEFESRWREDEKFNQDGEVKTKDIKDLESYGHNQFQKSIRVSLGLVQGLVQGLVYANMQ
jgi:hypothetical protein